MFIEVLVITANRKSTLLAHQQRSGQRKYVGYIWGEILSSHKKKTLSVNLSSMQIEDIALKEKVGDVG